jgi:hypothetical protein
MRLSRQTPVDSRQSQNATVVFVLFLGLVGVGALAEARYSGISNDASPELAPILQGTTEARFSCPDGEFSVPINYIVVCLVNARSGSLTRPENATNSSNDLVSQVFLVPFWCPELRSRCMYPSYPDVQMRCFRYRRRQGRASLQFHDWAVPNGFTA